MQVCIWLYKSTKRLSNSYYIIQKGMNVKKTGLMHIRRSFVISNYVTVCSKKGPVYWYYVNFYMLKLSLHKEHTHYEANLGLSIEYKYKIVLRFKIKFRWWEDFEDAHKYWCYSIYNPIENVSVHIKTIKEAVSYCLICAFQCTFASGYDVNSFEYTIFWSTQSILRYWLSNVILLRHNTIKVIFLFRNFKYY